MPTRRDLLRAGAVSALGFGMGGGLESALAALVPRPSAAPRPRGDRVVVAVNLFGGNDGLNTVVPLRQYDRYRALRPTVGWERDRLIPLPGHEDDFGLNPGMAPLADLFRTGKVAIVNGVACPRDAQGLFDHEASQQNFLTGATYGSAPPEQPTGWLGRLLDRLDGRVLPGGVDFSSAPLLLTGATSAPLSLSSIGGFSACPSADSGARHAAHERPRGLPAAAGVTQRDQALRAQVLALSGALLVISDAYEVTAGVSYPATHLGAALRDCAALIAADQGVRALAVGCGGFDTHSQQNVGPPDAPPYHQGLWRAVSEAVVAFDADVRGHGLGARVVVVVFSEFGRRVYENHDLGTDHGLAGATLVIGDPVRGGLYGDYPDLGDDYLVLDGNLDLTTDFRSVYATILAQHLGADPEPILGGSFPLLGFV